MPMYNSFDEFKKARKKERENRKKKTTYNSFEELKQERGFKLSRSESQKLNKNAYTEKANSRVNTSIDQRKEREKAEYKSFASKPAVQDFTSKNKDWNYDKDLKAFSNGSTTRSIKQIENEYNYKPVAKPLTEKFDLGKTQIQPKYTQAPYQRVKDSAKEFNSELKRQLTGYSDQPKQKLEMNEKMDILYVPANYDMDNQADFMKANWHLGKLQDLSGKEWAKKAKGKENIADQVGVKIAEFYDKYPQVIENDKNYVKQGLGGTAQMLPTQLGALKAGVKGGVAGGVTAGIGAAALGQAGPQVLTPEELLTVPGAFVGGYKVGSAGKSAEYMYKVEKGSSYQELIEAGVEPEKADLISDGVGMLNAGIEIAQIGYWVKTLGKSIGIVNNPLFKNQLNSKGVKLLLQYAKSVGFESIQELGQEAVTVGGTAIGTGENPFTKENATRLMDTFTQSVKTFSIMMLTGPLAGGSKMGYDQYKSRTNEMDLQVDAIIDKSEKEGTDPGKVAEMRQTINIIRMNAPNSQIKDWADSVYKRLETIKNEPEMKEKQIKQKDIKKPTKDFDPYDRFDDTFDSNKSIEENVSEINVNKDMKDFKDGYIMPDKKVDIIKGIDRAKEYMRTFKNEYENATTEKGKIKALKDYENQIMRVRIHESELKRLEDKYKAANAKNYIDQDKIDSVEKNLKRGITNSFSNESLDQLDLDYINKQIKSKEDWINTHIDEIEKGRHKSQIASYNELLGRKQQLENENNKADTKKVKGYRNVISNRDISKTDINTVFDKYKGGAHTLADIAKDLKENNYNQEELDSFVANIYNEYDETEAEDIIDNFYYQHDLDFTDSNSETVGQKTRELDLAEYYETDYTTEEYKQDKIDKYNKESNDGKLPYAGIATAGFNNKNIEMDPKYILENTEGGLTGEDVRANDPKDKYGLRVEKIAQDMQKNGYDNSNPVFINVDHNGNAWINEGNKRVRAAIKNKFSAIPVEIKYFDFGEEVSGKPFDPIKVSNNILNPGSLKGPSKLNGKRQYAFNQESYDNMLKDRESKKKTTETPKEVKEDPTDSVIDKALETKDKSLKSDIYKAETGKNIELELYHGKGKTASEIYSRIEYPILGNGNYYATNGKDASKYGDNITKETVKLDNPLVIKNDDQWRELTKEKVGWRYPKFSLSDDVDIAIAEIKNLKKYIVDQGHDGVVIILNKSNSYNETLRDMFEHDQVVKYDQAKEAKQEQPANNLNKKIKTEGINFEGEFIRVNEEGYLVRKDDIKMMFWHGSNNDFNSFKSGGAQNGEGIYFTSDPAIANYLDSDYIYGAQLIMKNPMVERPSDKALKQTDTFKSFMEYSKSLKDILKGEGETVFLNEVARELGYDGIIRENWTTTDVAINEYIVFDGDQVDKISKTLSEKNQSLNDNMSKKQKFVDKLTNDDFDSITAEAIFDHDTETLQKFIDDKMLTKEIVKTILDQYDDQLPGKQARIIKNTLDIVDNNKMYRGQHVSFNTAYDANRNISFSPDNAAERNQKDFVTIMNQVENEVMSIAETDEMTIKADELLEEFAKEALDKYNTYLNAKAGVVSPAIAGRANFNQKQADKRRKSSELNYTKFDDFVNKSADRIKKQVLGEMSDDLATQKQIDKYIKEADKVLAIMKLHADGDTSYSKSAFRNSLRGKIETLANNGEIDVVKAVLDYVKENQSKPIIFSSRNGVWDLVDEAKIKATDKTESKTPETIAKFEDGTTIENDFANKRVKISFPGKPDSLIIRELKSHAWRWSPTNEVWQRKNTGAAVESAKRIVGNHIKKIEQTTKATDPITIEEVASFKLGDKMINMNEYPYLDLEQTDILNDNDTSAKDDQGYSDGYIYLTNELLTDESKKVLESREMKETIMGKRILEKMITEYDILEPLGIYEENGKNVIVLMNNKTRLHHVDHKFYDYLVEKEGYSLAGGKSAIDSISIVETPKMLTTGKLKVLGVIMPMRGKEGMTYDQIRDDYLPIKPSPGELNKLMFNDFIGIDQEYLDQIKEKYTTTAKDGIKRINYKAIKEHYDNIIKKSKRMNILEDQFVRFDEGTVFESGSTDNNIYVFEGTVDSNVNGDLQLKNTDTGSYTVYDNKYWADLTIAKKYIANTRLKGAQDRISKLGYDNVTIPLLPEKDIESYKNYIDELADSFEVLNRFKDKAFMINDIKYKFEKLDKQSLMLTLRNVEYDTLETDREIQEMLKAELPVKSQRIKADGLNFLAKRLGSAIQVSFYNGSSLVKDEMKKTVRLNISGTKLRELPSVMEVITEAMNMQFFDRNRPSVEITSGHKIAIEEAINEVYANEYKDRKKDTFKKMNYDPSKPQSMKSNYDINNMYPTEYRPGPLRDKKLRSIQLITKDIMRDFKVGNTSKRYRSKALAHYKPFPKVIEEKIENNIGITMHELGHHFDHKYNLQEKFLPTIKEMIPKLPKELAVNYSPDELAGEAIAEFVRLYMTKPKTALDFSAAFADDFIRTLSDKDLNMLNGHRDEILNWIDSTPREQMFSTIRSNMDNTVWNDVKNDFSGTVAKWKKSGYNFLFDTSKPIQDLVGLIEKMTDKKLKNVENFYLLAEHANDSSMIAKSIRKNYLVDPQGEKIGVSLNSIISRINKKEFADFSNYLKAKRSIDLHNREHRVYSDDIPIETIEMEVAAYEQEKPHFITVSNELYEWWQAFTQAWIVDTGLLEQDVWDHMKELDPHYVPLFRSTDDVTIINNEIRQMSSRGYTDKFSPTKRMSKKGNAKDTFNPIESMIIETDRYVTVVKRRAVMLAIHNKYQDMKKSGVLKTEEGEVDGIGFLINQVNPAQTMESVDITDQKNEAMIKLLVEFANQQDSPIVKRLLEKGKIIEALTAAENLGFESHNILNQTIDDVSKKFIPMAIDKETNIVSVKGEDGKNYHYEIYDQFLLEALLDMDTTNFDKTIQTVIMVRRFLQALYTTLDPFFIIRNVSRDFPQALVASQGNPIKFVEEFGLALADRLRRGELTQEYESMGGGYASPTGADRNALAESMAEMIPGWRREHKLRTFLQSVERFADATEQAPRMAEYKQHINNFGNAYGDKLQAIYEAKDVTVNFGRRGGIMKTALGNSIPFLNAGLEGFDKIRRMHDKENIKKTLPKALLAITMFQFANMAYWYSDEDRKKRYLDVAKYIKDNYWLFPNLLDPEGPMIRIAKPRELAQIYGSAFNRIYDRIFENDGQAFEGFGGTIIRTFLPPTDTVFSGISDIKSNTSWYGGTIVGYAEQNLQVDFRADRNTSGVAKLLAKVLPDFESFSPMNIDYLIKQYTGVFGKFAISGTDQIKGNFLEPIERAFTSDEAYSNNHVQNFYNHLEHLDQVYTTARKKGTYKGFYNKDLHDTYKIFAEKMSTGYDLRDQLEIVRTYPSDEQRKIYLEFIKVSKSLDEGQFKEMSIKEAARAIQYEIMLTAEKAEEIYREVEKGLKNK